MELEKLASRKLKVNAKETMKIAEKLYTQGLVSYPRTETNIFPQGLDLEPLIQEQTGDPQWGGVYNLWPALLYCFNLYDSQIRS